MQGPNDNVKMFETFVLTYDHEQVLAENERLRSLLRRGLQQIEMWQQKYGKWNPEWLPPAGGGIPDKD